MAKVDLIRDTRLNASREAFVTACKFSRQWNYIYDWAIKKYYASSNIPQKTKEKLRFVSYAAQFHKNLGLKYRPYRVKHNTMYNLWRHVAETNGTGKVTII